MEKAKEMFYLTADETILPTLSCFLAFQFF